MDLLHIVCFTLSLPHSSSIPQSGELHQLQSTLHGVPGVRPEGRRRQRECVFTTDALLASLGALQQLLEQSGLQVASGVIT